ncbi:hypothetical protein ASPZODRAFT_146146 [Penicilliopsis zonata CBS 506.65]|uniref:GDP/GTP exchange factor Sec2 N-terminal domain-containing protein n=1 Tax=Penicilliopsis zonata CBS 506.65 TaxID=1073090 RepID=A0A1L9S8E4_9EURO|nr:hypothetical protein ASPZODRAFT_146146 [Penicilliopsis zonata CBS 506.65]OJJ43431.1 hypothetical protein ASPZODRAFT_146146 [Penicilliopsis zonata CBS 506.65]
MLSRSSNTSSGQRSLSPGKTVTRAKSTNDLAQNANDDNILKRTTSALQGISERDFNTLRDPRLTVTSEVSEESSQSSHHPDLSNEVAALSVKLIQAINNQTTLDDTLVATRQELEDAQKKLRTLEAENQKFRQDVAAGVLIKKIDTEHEILRLKADLAEERAQRSLAERGKKSIEQELETLTAALFEEANKMVAAAKLEREAVEKKNEQLRSQIKDTELLLASNQDQLSELKLVIQEMNIAKDESDITTPSSPAVAQQMQGMLRKTPDLEIPDMTPITEEVCPGPSTSFPQFFRVSCRTDIHAYDDFRDLLVTSKSSKPPSRVASGSYSGLNVMGLASLATGGLGSAASSPSKSSQNASPTGAVSSPQQAGSHAPLKETRFYKRVLVEDIEPTLRLDAAPSISWLTRRSVMSAICEGSLLVEPMPTAAKVFNLPCSLCGERRNDAEYERTHRFRTSESETAQRYSLCILCLERVRSCCEFTGYLRHILDGHIRLEDTEEEKDAWEETIRLRERMFWSRIGGGVIPVVNHSSPALNNSQNSNGDEIEPSEMEAHKIIDVQQPAADSTCLTPENIPESAVDEPEPNSGYTTPLEDGEPQEVPNGSTEDDSRSVSTEIQTPADPPASIEAEETITGLTAEGEPEETPELFNEDESGPVSTEEQIPINSTASTPAEEPNDSPTTVDEPTTTHETTTENDEIPNSKLEPISNSP